MQNTRFFFILVPILFAILGVLLYVNLSSQQTLSTELANPSSPFSSSNLFSNSSHSGSEVVSQTINTNPSESSSDFTAIPDVAFSPAGFYLLSFPPIPTGEDIEAATTTSQHSYEIYFFPNTHLYLVLLLKEPIAATRQLATEALINGLGLSANEVCTLTYEVNVPYWVNQFYSARNLGFPGCPGAVTLPEN